LIYQITKKGCEILSITEFVGKKIRYYRKNKRKTLEELSSVSGLTVNYLSMIEKGQANATLMKLELIIYALEINWTDIIPIKHDEGKR
jgi:transcriptional regulator with XRE-family HTH domain